MGGSLALVCRLSTPLLNAIIGHLPRRGSSWDPLSLLAAPYCNRFRDCLVKLTRSIDDRRFIIYEGGGGILSLDQKLERIWGGGGKGGREENAKCGIKNCRES